MFYDDRPKLKLEKSQVDLYLEYVTWGLIICSLIYTIVYYSRLPEKIPMHFIFLEKSQG